MIISSQVRAARALLNWSAQDLAGQSGLHRATIQRMEGRQDSAAVGGHAASLDAVLTVFQANGIEFISENGMVGVVLDLNRGDKRPAG